MAPARQTVFGWAPRWPVSSRPARRARASAPAIRGRSGGATDDPIDLAGCDAFGGEQHDPSRSRKRVSVFVERPSSASTDRSSPVRVIAVAQGMVPSTARIIIRRPAIVGTKSRRRFFRRLHKRTAHVPTFLSSNHVRMPPVTGPGRRTPIAIAAAATSARSGSTAVRESQTSTRPNSNSGGISLRLRQSSVIRSRSVSLDESLLHPVSNENSLGRDWVRDRVNNGLQSSPKQSCQHWAARPQRTVGTLLPTWGRRKPRAP